MESLGGFNLIGLTVLGGALLVATSLVYGPSRRASSDMLRRVLIVTGWFMVVIGITGAIAALANLAAIPLLVLAVLIGIVAFRRYHTQEQSARLWQVATAAERGLPLAEALAAFGRDGGISGWKATRQAEYLAAGESLFSALDATWDVPANGPALAVGAGTEWNCLAQTLPEALRVDTERDLTLRTDVGRLFYLYFVLLVIAFVTTFYTIKILPVFFKMLDDFGVRQGPALSVLPGVLEVVYDLRLALGPIIPLLILLIIAGALYYLELWPRRFPPFAWFTRRLDGATVMRCLAWAIEARQPIPAALRTMARYYQNAFVRSKLDRAALAVAHGEPWTSALAATRLIRPADAAVLQAAQRVGNLPWALRELADSNARRWGAWTKRILIALFPFLIAALGALVLLIALAVFETLANLVNALATEHSV